MIFELIAWTYISLICLIWGNFILRLSFGKNDAGIAFPVVCFIGMSFLGIISFYCSLVIPLNFVFKISLQIPVLLLLFNSRNRKNIVLQLKTPFSNFSVSDFSLLFVSLLMILFLASSPVIHPDTLNYHVFSVEIFNKYGTVTGIGNVKLDLGFQSLWFSELAFFNFSFFKSALWFPLNGTVMAWFIVFLLSRISLMKDKTLESKKASSAIWAFILILFCILSWTQIRLTASSLSPDFIAVISVLMSFYFFAEMHFKNSDDRSELMAIYFSVIAVLIKLSAAPILLIPVFIFGQAVKRNRWILAGRIIAMSALLWVPILIRNLISTGYPFYPSSFAAIFPLDWKMDISRILVLQHYITAYARFPVLIANITQEYNTPFGTWLPVWWKHLYLIDKVVIVFIIAGLLIDILFFSIWKRFYTGRRIAALVVSVTGIIFWFVNAPDPRFGTGFLIPMIYFQYAPFVPSLVDKGNGNIYGKLTLIKNIFSLLICIYIGYRTIYFFQPRQLILPEGIKYEALIQSGCEGQVKTTIFSDSDSLPRIPDSCRQFIYRGKTIEQGFKSAP
jgi:hypothetical protein